MQKCNTEWNMSIMGWVFGFLSHLSKSRCVRKLESCVRFSPVKVEEPPRMCVGAVESCEKSGNLREISVNKAIKT